MTTTNVEEKNEIKKAIADYCQAKAISRKDLSVQIGVSGATLSNIENDKWANIDDRMWLKISSYVKGTNTAKLFTTSDYSSIIKLCSDAKKNHYMSGLTADYGTGKTTALKAFARTENVYYVYFDINMKPKDFFFELGKQLGYEYDANVYSQVKKVSETLNSLYNPLVIIDEASKLNDKMLMSLHVLRDKTMHNCGIVLAGMPYFKSNLIKFAEKQKVGISEFLSRIMIWHSLNGLYPSEIEQICHSHGITDKRKIAELKTYRKFRDLVNQILLHNTIND